MLSWPASDRALWSIVSNRFRLICLWRSFSLESLAYRAFRTFVYRSQRKLLVDGFSLLMLLSMVLDISMWWVRLTDWVRCCLLRLIYRARLGVWSVFLGKNSLALVSNSFWREVTLFSLMRKDLDELSWMVFFERCICERCFLRRWVRVNYLNFCEVRG